MRNCKVLIVDDDPSICDLLLDVADSYHFEAKSTSTARKFMEIYNEFQPNIIILDLHLGDTDGVELLRQLSETGCYSKIILISGYGEKILSVTHLLGQTHGLQMMASLQKPINIAQLKEELEKIEIEEEAPALHKLKEAITKNQLILHFQPKIQLLTNCIVGFESLVRWQPQPQSLILPDKFIPAAEEMGLIPEITLAVVEQGFQYYSKLNCRQNGQVLSINLSRKDLDSLDFPDKVSALAEKYAVDPQHICFEVTETAVMGQPKIVMEILIRLRLKGFLLSIDDFGTGYSSLVELKKMPFNEIKIDKSFVLNLPQDKDNQIIVRAIVRLGHELGLKVAAEGVESDITSQLLSDYSCDTMQGFHISRPLPFDKLMPWVTTYPKLAVTQRE